MSKCGLEQQKHICSSVHHLNFSSAFYRPLVFPPRATRSRDQPNRPGAKTTGGQVRVWYVLHVFIEILEVETLLSIGRTCKLCTVRPTRQCSVPHLSITQKFLAVRQQCKVQYRVKFAVFKLHLTHRRTKEAYCFGSLQMHFPIYIYQKKLHISYYRSLLRVVVNIHVVNFSVMSNVIS